MFACLIQVLPKAGSLSFYFNSRAVLEFDFERLFSLISRAFIWRWFGAVLFEYDLARFFWSWFRALLFEIDFARFCLNLISRASLSVRTNRLTSLESSPSENVTPVTTSTRSFCAALTRSTRRWWRCAARCPGSPSSPPWPSATNFPPSDACSEGEGLMLSRYVQLLWGIPGLPDFAHWRHFREKVVFIFSHFFDDLFQFCGWVGQERPREIGNCAKPSPLFAQDIRSSNDAHLIFLSLCPCIAAFFFNFFPPNKSVLRRAPAR